MALRVNSGVGLAGAWFTGIGIGIAMPVLVVCLFLAYGNDYKGAWSLAVVPHDKFRPFAQGVHAALWILLVLLPNAFWLLVLAWSWGVVDAAVFIAYCTAVASLYLGVGLRLIAVVPIPVDDFVTRMRDSLKPDTPGSLFRYT